MLATGKPQLIEFFAFWSGPSLAMSPIVKGVEKEYARRVNFVYLDIDDPATKIFKLAAALPGGTAFLPGRRAWKSAPAMGGVCDCGAIPPGAGCSPALMPGAEMSEGKQN